jgi:uncharacterized protein
LERLHWALFGQKRRLPSGGSRDRDCEDIMSVLRHVVIVAVLIAAATFPEARTAMAAEGDKAAERYVSVSATGSVAADPDMATISTGVIVEADTAKDALVRNSAVMTKLIDGLKALGTAPKDMQTTAVNVEPRYVQAKDGRPATISGYRVVNQVRLTVREVKRLGEFLDAAITLGANQINGISFDVSNAETLRDEARKQAMVNAKRRAELYATAAGAQIGSVLTISEDASAGPRPMPMVRSMAAAAPIETGTRTLTVEVHVTYALR